MFPNKLPYKGKKNHAAGVHRYVCPKTPIAATLVNRIAQGNTVINQETVILKKGIVPLAAIAIYTISGHKIVAVHFIPSA